MLRPGDRPSLAAMIAEAERYLAEVSQPCDDAEAEFFARAARADLAPELLFGHRPDVLVAAQADPAARWKVQNLAKALHAN